MTVSQVTAAKAKGWTPSYMDNEGNWLEYAGPKCATPTISFANGMLQFECETEGVEFVSKVTSTDDGEYEGASIPLTAVYTVSVYAKKDDFIQSDVATKEITVGGSTAKKGDVNEDGTVNGTDIQEVINIIVDGENNY